jgi:Fe2+ or Zn2+ uptake regulation protein
VTESSTALLRSHGVQPSAQRVAVADYVLHTEEHPSADQVWARVKRGLPMLSRATVYNTLNLFVKHGLLRQLVLAEGKVVFDPNVERHHHFIDEATGTIHDVPWSALQVAKVDSLHGYDVREYQVVLRGRRRSRRKPAASSQKPT